LELTFSSGLPWSLPLDIPDDKFEIPPVSFSSLDFAVKIEELGIL
jgi:hypothetical protein